MASKRKAEKTFEQEKLPSSLELQPKKGIKLDAIMYETLYNDLNDRYTNFVENFRNIGDNLSAGFWMRKNTDGNIIFASKGMEGIFQIPLEILYKDPGYWKKVILPEYHDTILKGYERIRLGKNTKNLYQIKTEDGNIKWLYEETMPWNTNNGEISSLFGMILDVTREVKMQKELSFIAKYDAITKLPNQRSLYERLNSLIRRNQPFSLLYLDIEKLSVINGSLGYDVGDELLKQVVDRLSVMLPDNQYISRITSNDLVIVLADFQEMRAVSHLAEQLIREIYRPLTIQDYELQITSNIGVSFYPEDGNNKHAIIEYAQSAVHHAKKREKNTFAFYSELHDISSYKRFMLEKDMRKALLEEEFEIYYQPQVDVNGKIIGAEGLIRWNHPKLGLVSPGEFIPLAEENHLINDITDWLIEKACAQLSNWKQKGFELRSISINVSPIRFMKKGLVEKVKKQLELHQIQASNLELEVTEGSILHDDKRVFFALDELKKLGVSIAIDDFGTGYSSLRYLQEFQADVIKIDQGFIKKLNVMNKIDTAIVTSVIQLAKDLGLKTIAEGVEKQEQLDFLKKQGCDFIQGYLFSKPVPLREFEEMLTKGSLKYL